MPVLSLLIQQVCDAESKKERHAEKKAEKITREAEAVVGEENCGLEAVRPPSVEPAVPAPEMKKLSMLDDHGSEPFSSAVPRQAQRAPSKAAVQNQEDLMVMEDFDEDFNYSSSAPTAQVDSWAPSSTMARGMGQARVPGAGVGLAPDTARQIKAKLFGKLKNPDSWKQGFFYALQTRGLEYGLVQKQGGPCGILAAVQAHVLCALCPAEGGEPPKVERVTSAKLADALTDALAEALWQVALHAVPSPPS
ncbi:hypothetical protein CYMTET_50807 [Cymbomonas tetramitiformis]|uniref:Deubiquitinating enzyme MINDY-3/4 conserved domain-containing protein n=1 Tax=Cymbomonas tetramitiformis TaxID=36881 RepID=A0AAE0ESS7_9CHLO|nr:hypothetical protein CYMTET_50807 [Cymbomonas tetramitiformis]